MDFKEINDNLLARASTILSQWLPAGKLRGSEFTVGNLQGADGSSLSINIHTGRWADFASHDSGGDLISLYAAINCISQGDAAKKLDPKWKPSTTRTPAVQQSNTRPKPKNFKPPKGSEPIIKGHPAGVSTYRDRDGEPLFYIAKYVIDKKKVFSTYSWDGKQWQKKAWISERPIYGLELLNSKPILVVEGEKCADALRKISEHYTVVSWPGGGNAVDLVDWSTLYGRHVLVWPDCDDPGINTAEKICFLLHGKTESLKIIRVVDQPKSWDAADAVEDGWDWNKILQWAKPLAQIYEPPAAPVDVEDEPYTASLMDGHTCEALWEYMGLARMKSGAVHCNTDNVVRILSGTREFRGLVWFDEFHSKYFTKISGKTREWSDDDDLSMMVLIQNKLGLTKISEKNVNQAVRYLGKQDVRNEPKEWLESLTWDGVDRLDNFFFECFGTENSEYYKAASKNWFISMVARIFSPGCKVDNMVIFEASQAKLKSTALDVIGSPWYTEVSESVTSKDFYLAIQGKLLIEISELDAFSRAESNTIKKVVTCREDRFRPPYGRSTESFPRKCVFAGSTNEQHYLQDPTGGRRFWPVKIGEINIELIRKLKDQLFAEALRRYRSGEPWWVMPESAKDEQEDRRQQDPWENIIDSWLVMNQKTQVRSDEVAKDCLGLEVSKIDRRVQARICNILRLLRWDARTDRANGKSKRTWHKELTLDTG